MAQFKDPRFASSSDLSGPASEMMELVRLMLAECPYPIAEKDRRETAERRLRPATQALPRGEDRRASH